MVLGTTAMAGSFFLPSRRQACRRGFFMAGPWRVDGIAGPVCEDTFESDTIYSPKSTGSACTRARVPNVPAETHMPNARADRAKRPMTSLSNYRTRHYERY